MKWLRATSTRRLLTLCACAALLATTAAIAQAALQGSGPVPPPKPLARAIRDAVRAPAPDGVTARISFKNHLLPGGSLPGASSALTSGADGRLWLAKDGRLRLELQSRSGDVQVNADRRHITVFDGSSNTVYRALLPGQTSEKHDGKRENPTVAKIQEGLDGLAKSWALSGAAPTSTAGRPTYTLKIAPEDRGGLLGAGKLAWDSVTGVPLRAAVYAQGRSRPVLELKATDISYGAVPDSVFSSAPPAGAKVVELNPQPSAGDREGRPHAHARRGADEVSGVGAVRKRVGFTLAAPARLSGRERRGVRLVDFGGQPGALVTYGKGAGSIVVFERKAGARAGEGARPDAGARGRRDSALPQVRIGDTVGIELPTPLGTVVTFQRHGVSYVVAGSVLPPAARDAAQGLR
jgi:outer membrane lipoprotein-sorting protein